MRQRIESRRSRGLCVLAATAALALAGCDGPPLGGSPPAAPARSGMFASCPRLAGVYDMTDRTRSDGLHPWDELSIEPAADGALRFTWRYADRPDPSAVLRMEPDQVVRYRWTISQDERGDDGFLATVFDSRGLIGNLDSQLVGRDVMHCEDGWLSVPYVPTKGGMPNWPAGTSRNAQFTVDAQGALVADFSVHASQHGFFTPSSLWCGRACRDMLNGGHDIHAWIHAPRKLGTRTTSLDAAYDEGLDVMGSAPAAGEAVRARWRDRMQGLGATLTRVRMDERHVELTFAANDRTTLAAATLSMRQLHGLHGVVVRHYSGGTASPSWRTMAVSKTSWLVAPQCT